jgi:hypothetical protein
MAGTQRLLAIAMAFSLAGIPISAKPDALGIVVLADHASLGSQAASEGTTVLSMMAIGCRPRQGAPCGCLLAERCCALRSKAA